MSNNSEKIINKCVEFGINIDIRDKQLMSLIDSFDEMPTVKQADGKLVFHFYGQGTLKELRIGQDGKYSYSGGIGVF